MNIQSKNNKNNNNMIYKIKNSQTFKADLWGMKIKYKKNLTEKYLFNFY